MKLMEQLRVFLALVIIGITGHAQVGIGTITPDASAALDLTSTTKGLLLPRMEYNQMYHIVSPEEGLLVYCIDCDPKGLYYFNGTDFLSTTTGLISEPPSVVTGTGRTWMDRNLGALRVATSAVDADGYGDLYQWGRAADGHQERTSPTTSVKADTAIPNTGGAWDGNFINNVDDSPYDWLTTQDSNLWQGVDGVNNPCPTGYRIPTEPEWDAELLTWTSLDAAGAYASLLKMTMGGYRSRQSGSLKSEGSRGLYWSSTTSIGSYEDSHYLNILDSSASIVNSARRANAFSVRCIKD